MDGILIWHLNYSDALFRCMLHQSTKFDDISFVWNTVSIYHQNPTTRDKTFIRGWLSPNCTTRHSDLRQKMVHLFEACEKSLCWWSWSNQQFLSKMQNYTLFMGWRAFSQTFMSQVKCNVRLAICIYIEHIFHHTESILILILIFIQRK